MSLNPPTRRISPLTMPNFDDERMLMFRVPSMDSSVAFSEASSVGPWVCPQCSYSNVDSGNDRCALCGREDRDHREKKAAKKSRKSSWLSLGNAINGGSSPSPKQLLEEVKEDSIMPPPTEPQKKQTSLGLPSKNAMPISRRPDREAPEGDDAEPTISLPKRIPNSPTQNSGPPALMGNSLAASFLRAESINSQSEQNDERIARTARTNTSHSRDESVRTIRISNAKTKAPAGDSPPSTPPMSNKSISSSTCSPERSVSAPPLGTMPNTGTDGDQLTIPTLQQRHSDTMSDRRNNNLFHPACQTSQEDDLEQPSYLPNSIRTTNAGRDTRGHNSSNNTASISSTRLVPPARKSSGPPAKILTDPYNYVQSESNSKKGGESRRKTKDTQKRKGVKQNVNNTKSRERDKFINDWIIPSQATANNKNPTSKDNNVSVHTIATHETTPRNSFTSASFADERSIETGLSEHQQARQVPVPFEVMAPGDDNDGGGGGGGDDDGIGRRRYVAKSRVKVFCLLGTALLVVSAVVAFLVTKVFMVESELDATNTEASDEVSDPTTISLIPSITPTTAPAISPPTSEPTAAKPPPPTEGPGTVLLDLLFTIDGNVSEQFGLVVSSVTGAGSDWVAVGGIDFVRIFRLEGDHFVQIGDDLTNNNKMLFQVSLGSNHVAITWQEELTIQQFDSSDNKWNDVFTLDDFDSEDIISTAMSANGGRFVVAVVSPDSSSAVVDIYRWNRNGNRNGNEWEFEYSFDVDNSNKQMIQLEISHNGESIVVLASGRVVSYLIDNIGGWEWANIPVAGGGNNATALSGDGRVCAVANPSRTLTIVYDEISQKWEHGYGIEEEGIHAMALDHSGHFLAVSELIDTKLGSVSVWYQDTTEADFTSIREIQGEMDSGFGASVAMTNSTNSDSRVLVVGAPHDRNGGKNAGRAHFYKIQEVGGNGK